MASLFFYKKKDEISIFDLMSFKDGKLDLEAVKELLDSNPAGYNSDNIFNKEGYTQTEVNDGILTSTYIFKNTLGKYTTVGYDLETKKLKVSRLPYFYFGQSKLLIKDNVNIMVKANYSSEECVKGKCIEFFDEIGIDIEPIKFNNKVFQYIRNKYTWKKIKLQKIENEKDSTRNISYEIDPSSDKESQVDIIYNECGVFESIYFNIKFKEELYNVKLYKKGNKVTVEESQFPTKEIFEEFCLYLMNEIIKIVNDEYEEEGECDGYSEEDSTLNEGDE